MILKCVSQIQYPTLTSSSIHRVFMSVLDLNCKWGNIHGVVRKRPPPARYTDWISNNWSLFGFATPLSPPYPPLRHENKLWETLPWLIVINNKRGKNSVQLCVCLWPDSGQLDNALDTTESCGLCGHVGCIEVVSGWCLPWSHPIIPSIWCPSTNP